MKQSYTPKLIPLLLVGLLFSITPLQVLADNGVVIMDLTFNASGVLDNSSNPINFTTYGSPLFTTGSAKFGTYLIDLDNTNDYIAITGYNLSSKLNLNSSSASGSTLKNMTVLAWVAFDDVAANYDLVFGFQGHGGGCTEGACGFDFGNWPGIKAAEGRIATSPSVQVGCQNAGSNSIATEWNMWVWKFDGANWYAYLNTTQTCGVAATENYFPNNANFYPKIGYTGSNQNEYSNFRMANLCVINASLNASQLAEYYNGGVGNVPCSKITGVSLGAPPTPPQPSSPELTVTAANYYGGSLNNFSVIIYNSTASFINSTTSGSLKVGGTITNLSSYSINVSSNSSTFYPYTGTFTISAVGLTYTANLTLPIMNISYTGNITNSINGNLTNWVRNLSYSASVSSCYGNSVFQVIINGSVYSSSTISCRQFNASEIPALGNQTTITGSYLHLSESFYNISFRLVNLSQFNLNVSITNTTFRSDTTAPLVILNWTLQEGFFSVSNFTASLQCNDSYINLGYNFTSASGTLSVSNQSSGFVQTNFTPLVDGINWVAGQCSDLFQTNTSNISFNVYNKLILLWHEINNTAFNPSGNNTVSAKVWFGDNSSFYDFKANGRSNVSFVNFNSPKLRVELTYLTGNIVTRFIDASLISDSNVKVCALQEGYSYFPQIFYSAVETPVVVKNTFTQCFIGADSTRFAFQDSLILKAFSINSVYYLYTFTDGVQVFLASLDGSIQAEVNLDQLQFQSSGYNLNVFKDALAFKKVNDVDVSIYYVKSGGGNSGATLTITRQDTGEVVLNTNDFVDPNEWNVIFNFATLTNVTSSTLFKAVVTTADADGVVSSITKYFNTSAATGLINSTLAIILSFFILVFGLTFTAARTTFTWFGLFAVLASMAVLSFAVPSSLLLVAWAVEGVVIIYVMAVMMKNQLGLVT